MWSASRPHAPMPGGLLRGVVEQRSASAARRGAAAHAGRGGGAEHAGDAVRAPVRQRLVPRAAQAHRDARADVVAERDRAQEVRPVDAESLAERQRGGDHRAAGVRARWAVGVVGLVGVREHAVGERGLDRPAERRGRRRPSPSACRRSLARTRSPRARAAAQRRRSSRRWCRARGAWPSRPRRRAAGARRRRPCTRRAPP